MQNFVVGKIKLVHVVTLSVAFLLVIFAVRWQVVDAAKLTDEIAARKRAYLIPSVRGPILARDGSTLAYSEPRFDLFMFMPEVNYAERLKLQTREELYSNIVEVTGMERKELEDLVNTRQKEGAGWFRISKELTLEQKDKIEKLRRNKDKGILEGLALVYAQKRFYPEKSLASQVIGFARLNEDGTMDGVTGIEADRTRTLEPQKGYTTYDIDAKGNPVSGSTKAVIQAKRGSSIYTTIDKYLQQKLEEHIKAGVERYQAKGATGVIVDPKTGAILAMANFPTFDPNDLNVPDVAVFGNPAVSQPYEIGSVGKSFTLAAAIDTDTYQAESRVIDGHQGCEDLIEGFRVCNLFSRKSGPLTLERATVLSDNVAYYHISKVLGPDTLYKYLDKFGIGKPSAVDLQGESYGFLKQPAKWNENDISAYSYGTSYQMNATQAIASVAAIANYGVRMQPRIVEKIIDADGRENLLQPRAVEQIISEESSRKVSKIMNAVFRSNLIEPYYKAKLANAPIAMKSGTGLIVKNGVYIKDYNATYVGFDVTDQRKFAMLIRLDSPQVGKVSSENARTVWLDTFIAIRDYLGV